MYVADQAPKYQVSVRITMNTIMLSLIRMLELLTLGKNFLDKEMRIFFYNAYAKKRMVIESVWKKRIRRGNIEGIYPILLCSRKQE